METETLPKPENGVHSENQPDMSQSVRLKQVREIMSRINLPPLAPDENGLTMDEIVEECHSVRHERYTKQHQTQQIQ